MPRKSLIVLALVSVLLLALPRGARADNVLKFGRLDHMVLDSATMVIGAMVLSDRRISQLPADQRALLTQTGEVASRELTRRIRAEDDAAFARLREKMTTRSLSDSEKVEWREVFRTVRDRPSQQGVFPPELIARIERMGG